MSGHNTVQLYRGECDINEVETKKYNIWFPVCLIFLWQSEGSDIVGLRL